MADQCAGYQLIQRLGQGGMAEVWRATHTSLGATKTVAIKLIHEQFGKDEYYRALFIREATLAMKLNMPNIVQVFDVGEDEGTLYMVMEWVQGTDLSKLIQLARRSERKIPLEVVLYAIGELLTALEAAHGLVDGGRPLELIHRDVSPHNVLVGRDGSVKLTDFGIARGLTTEDLSQAVSGAKGKMRYMAREHAVGKPTQQSDLFGAGAVLYEMLTGKLFRSTAVTEMELYELVYQEKEPPQIEGIPAEVQELVDGLLHPDLEKRFPHAQKALEQLENCHAYRHGRRALARLYEELCGSEPMRSGSTREVVAADWELSVTEDEPTRQRFPSPVIPPTARLPDPTTPVSPPAVLTATTNPYKELVRQYALPSFSALVVIALLTGIAWLCWPEPAVPSRLLAEVSLVPTETSPSEETRPEIPSPSEKTQPEIPPPSEETQLEIPLPEETQPDGLSQPPEEIQFKVPRPEKETGKEKPKSKEPTADLRRTRLKSENTEEKKPPIPVYVRTEDMRSVEFKIKNQTYRVTKNGLIKLTPGRYRVRWGFGGTEPLHASEWITVGAEDWVLVFSPDKLQSYPFAKLR